MSYNPESNSERRSRPTASFVPAGRRTEVPANGNAPIYLNDSFNEGGNANSNEEDAFSLNGNAQQPADSNNNAEVPPIPVRSQLALHDGYLAQQVRASSYGGGPGADVIGPAGS